MRPHNQSTHDSQHDSGDRQSDETAKNGNQALIEACDSEDVRQAAVPAITTLLTTSPSSSFCTNRDLTPAAR